MQRMVVGLAIVCALAIAAVPTASGGGEKKVFGIQDCGKPRVKPKRIVLACADFGLYANHFDWRHWGARKARTDGVLHAKDCTPSCAEGRLVDYPVEVILRKIKTETCNGITGRFYTKIKLNFPAEAPDFANRIPKDLFCI
jgi:hypothetical protein